MRQVIVIAGLMSGLLACAVAEASIIYSFEGTPANQTLGGVARNSRRFFPVLTYGLRRAVRLPLA